MHDTQDVTALPSWRTAGDLLPSAPPATRLIMLDDSAEFWADMGETVSQGFWVRGHLLTAGSAGSATACMLKVHLLLQVAVIWQPSSAHCMLGRSLCSIVVAGLHPWRRRRQRPGEDAAVAGRPRRRELQRCSAAGREPHQRSESGRVRLALRIR
jgi:hypothetical protein